MERGADLQRAADATRRKSVVGVVGVSSKLHELGHRSSSGTGVVGTLRLVDDIDGRMIFSPVELEDGLAEELELTARALMDIGHDLALCLSVKLTRPGVVLDATTPPLGPGHSTRPCHYRAIGPEHEKLPLTALSRGELSRSG